MLHQIPLYQIPLYQLPHPQAAIIAVLILAGDGDAYKQGIGVIHHDVSVSLFLFADGKFLLQIFGSVLFSQYEDIASVQQNRGPGIQSNRKEGTANPCCSRVKLVSAFLNSKADRTTSEKGGNLAVVSLCTAPPLGSTVLLPSLFSSESWPSSS